MASNAIDFSQSPYYDNFDEAKGFYRVLYRPGVGIQSRELNQTQSILQTQIARLGHHIFKDGSVVIPGNFAVDQQVRIEVDIANGITLANLIDQEIFCLSSGLGSHMIVTAVSPSSVTQTHDYIYVKSIRNSVSNSVAYGEVGQTMYWQTYTNGVPDVSVLTIGTIISTGVSGESTTNKSVVVTIDEGVYFVKDTFVKVFRQVKPIGLIDNLTDCKIGLDINETIVDEFVDESLLDPAFGSSSYLAPGAHRYKIELVINSHELSANTDTNFVELTRFKNGLTVDTKDNRPEYSELFKTLAQKTYEINGNMMAWTPTMTPKPYYRNGKNHGVANETQIYSDYAAIDSVSKAAALVDAKTKLLIVLSASSGYVNGYRVSIKNNTSVTLRRGRDTKQVSGVSTLYNDGSYFYIAGLTSVPDLSTTPIVELRDSGLLSSNAKPGTIIGYARVKSISYHSGTGPSNADAVFKMFVQDVSFTTSYSAKDVASFSVAASASTYIMGNVVQMYYMINNNGQFVANTTAVVGSGTGYGVKVFRWDSSLKRLFAIKQGAFNTVSRITNGTYTGTGTVPYTFTGGNGTGAVVTVNVSSGSVTSVVVTTAGSGYTTPPTTAVRGTPTGTAVVTTDATFNIGITWDLPLSVGDNVHQSTVYSTVSGMNSLNTNELASRLIKIPSPWVNAVKTSAGISNTSYTLQRKVSIAPSTSSSSLSAGQTFVSPITNDNYLVYRTDTGAVVDATTTLSISGQTLVNSLAASIIVYAPVNSSASAGVLSSKVITPVSLVISAPTYPVNIIPLGTTDAYQLIGMYESVDAGTEPTTGDKDISSNWTLIPNQTQNDYFGSYLKLDPGQPVPVGKVLIEYTKFVSSGEFSTIDSYSSIGDDYQAYAPSAENNSLRDYIDFRIPTVSSYNKCFVNTVSGSPVVTLTGLDTSTDMISVGDKITCKDFAWNTSVLSKTATTVTLSGNATATSTYVPMVSGFTVLSNTATTTSSTGSLMNGTYVQYDYSFFLPRVDSIYVNSDNNLSIIEGTSAEQPKIGTDASSASSMKLCDVIIPPYTPDYNFDKIVIIPRDHKTYKMQDIGLLEKRISNLEVQTTNNLLRQDVKDNSIIDANTGLSRFKSGFFVDTFSDMSSANTNSGEYRVSMDTAVGEIRPEYFHYPVPLEINTTTLTQWGDFYTLPYTEVVAITQDLATTEINANGCAVFTWEGNMKTFPQSYTWVDNTVLPNVTSTSRV